MESKETTTSMPVDDEVDESNAARKPKRSRKSNVWQEMTEGKNAKDDKVLSLTVDNASYNDVMVKHMKNRLRSRGMLEFGRKPWRKNLSGADLEECGQDDVHVKDFLPAMKAVCDRLEQAEGKVYESLNDTRRLASYHSTLLLPLLEPVVVVLVKAMKNPRSALCKTSIMAATNIFVTCHDKLLEPDFSGGFEF
uniref:Uncharacterized protein n=1 Tax=Chenopodium quinoa TaxID=63459 RepID=A0A803M8A3_CHEQI